MKLITTTGYGATGSSVVTDLLKEFKNVKSMGDFEFRFLQDPHGLRDLEYGLFENNNRLNTDYYIKQFIKYIDYISKSPIYNYERFFDNKFKKISQEFINSLIDIQWDGYWHQDIIDEKPIKKFFYYLERVYQKKILKQKDSGANFYKNKMYYARPLSKEDFYKKVQDYTTKLFQIMNKKNHDFLVLDQLVPVDHNQTYLNYFENLKIIIVDRDPRDLYLLEKHEYKEMFIPYQDVKTFVKWYRMVRQCKSNQEHPQILRLKFEDFIYKYDETIQSVMNFLDLKSEHWVNKQKYFDPSISIKNTNKKRDYISAEDKNEIAYIEQELSEYCYRFNG